MADSQSNTLRSGFLPDRIIHLHPTLTCNLACSHCYSESGPTRKKSLGIDAIERVLPYLKAEGYQQISLSGGDPMTYKHLLPLIDLSHAHGFRVTMVTNGLFPEKRMDEVASRLDGMAISFDGLAATHDRIRGRSGAFTGACSTVSRLVRNDIPVSAAVSVTREAIPDLPDLVDHLADLGVRAIQIRPVAAAGRAVEMSASIPNVADRGRLYLVVMALQEELGAEVRLHCDLAPARGLWQQRNAYSALLAGCTEACGSDPASLPLADLVNPLIITESGVLKPLAYDFSSFFDIASVDSIFPGRLTDYKRHDLPAFRQLIGGALARLEHGNGLIDWFDHCTRSSEELGEMLMSRSLNF